MRRNEMMTAGGVTLAALGVMVGLAIGSNQTGATIAQRTQPVEVRTEVVRKTVNVYRRAKPHHVAGVGPGTSGRSSSTSPYYARPATGTAGAPTTRTSGARAVVPSSSATPPVSTRSSGGASRGGSGATKAVSTRSSGGGDGGGGHDD
jgi:hypothetical protein